MAAQADDADRPRYVDPLTLITALLPLAALAVDASGVIYYRQGLCNEPLSFAGSAVALSVVLSLACAILLVRGWTLWRRRDRRATFCLLLLPFVLMAWPAVWTIRPTPIEIYRRGLAEWARANVHAGALRAWHGSLPPMSSPTRLPPMPVPPEVLKLEPSLIEQHPGGILLQWGTRQTMPGRQRKLFVAVDEATAPPPEGRRFWVAVRPGVWMGTHDPP